MAVIKQVTLPSGNTYDLKDILALEYIGTLGTGGTITELPVAGASNKNNLYRVITAGTYQSKIVAVDDLIWSDGTAWNVIKTSDSDTTYTFAEGTVDKAFQVTPLGGSAQSVPIHGLGDAALKGVDQTVTQNSGNLVTSAAVWTAIDNLPEPMVFRGTLGAAADNPTITALPVDGSAQVGDTYKVITAGTYDGVPAKIGDMFICLTKTSSANTWSHVPSGDEPSGTVTNVAAGVGLTTADGNPITTSGTVKAKLKSETASSLTAANRGSTADREYPIGVDANGDLSVNVPWVDTNTEYTFAEGSTAGAFSVTPSGGSAQTVKVHDAVTDVTYDSTNSKFKKTVDGVASDIATVSSAAIPNVTDAGSATAVTLPTFTVADEVLTITAGSVTPGAAPTIGTPITAVTGFTAS